MTGGYIFSLSTQAGGGGNYPVPGLGGGGYPISGLGRGYPISGLGGGYPISGLDGGGTPGTPDQVWMGVPGVPTPHKTEQHSKHLLHGRRCASCVHAGGLSCLPLKSCMLELLSYEVRREVMFYRCLSVNSGGTPFLWSQVLSGEGYSWPLVLGPFWEYPLVLPLVLYSPVPGPAEPHLRQGITPVFLSNVIQLLHTEK